MYNASRHVIQLPVTPRSNKHLKSYTDMWTVFAYPPLKGRARSKELYLENLQFCYLKQIGSRNGIILLPSFFSKFENYFTSLLV